MDRRQVEWLANEVRRRFGVPATKVIVTHAHDNTIGGLAAARRLGAVSYAEALTF